MLPLVISILLACIECSGDNLTILPVDAGGNAVQATSVTWSVDGGDESVVECDGAEGACDEVYIPALEDGVYAVTVVAGAQSGTGELTVTGTGAHQANDPGCDDVVAEELTVVVQ